MSEAAIIGAGPAGMACAYTLAKAGRPATLFERDAAPGGLCRTLDFDGYLFDIGGHRFLTKSADINQLWHSVMGNDMLHVKRLSRIYYRKRFFNYPLSFFNSFWNLGPFESMRCVASYFKDHFFPTGNDATFEGWITNRFGRRLYEIFFNTYTEKVWAVACKDLSADWAVQRIKGLSLRVALQQALFPKKSVAPKTLSEKFLYPRTGPGEFYNRLEQLTSSLGGVFKFGHAITGVKHERGRVTALEIEEKRGGKAEEYPLDHVFSTMPLPLLVKYLIPRAPDGVLAAAGKLCFRSFVVVNVILDKEYIFPDQWIYVHEPEVKMGRIQNYKNWSPAMTIDPKKTSLGLEYFCAQNDEFWNMNDVDMINFAMQELEKIGIASRKLLINGFVVRRPHVYPVYSMDYQKNIKIVRDYLEGFKNLQTFGREGLFRYDNSDHALLTGIYAARNFLGEGPFDVWSVNTDAEYLES